MDARVLESRLRGRSGRRARSDSVYVFVWPFLGFWTAFEAGCQIGAHCIPAGGMSSEARLVDDGGAGSHGRLLHADLCAAADGSGAREARRDEIAKSSVRVLIVAGEAGRQHRLYTRSDRARLGRAGHRSPWADGSGSSQLRVLGVSGGLHLNEAEYIGRGARARRGARSCRRRAWGARRDEPRPHCQPAHSLPNRRYRRPATRSVRVRAHLCEARRWDSRASRRHGERAGRQRLPVGCRIRCPPFRRGYGVSRDSGATADAMRELSLEVELMAGRQRSDAR